MATELQRSTWKSISLHPRVRFSPRSTIWPTRGADLIGLPIASSPATNDKLTLFPRSRSVNVTEGPAEDRPMTTGLHTVRDISCSKCGEVLGWKYGEWKRAFTGLRWLSPWRREEGSRDLG